MIFVILVVGDASGSLGLIIGLLAASSIGNFATTIYAIRNAGPERKER
jgi:hypothetical protein